MFNMMIGIKHIVILFTGLMMIAKLMVKNLQKTVLSFLVLFVSLLNSYAQSVGPTPPGNVSIDCTQLPALTGVITTSAASCVTSLTAQTGTGTTVVVNTSPTLITPVLGVATGTSLALGGGTALATTNQTGTGSLVLSASPTLTGTVTYPTPFTLGATSVTSTGTQLNYLNAATGTTGTASTNVVFSTSPTLVTPVLGAATATSINFGGSTFSVYATGSWTPVDSSGAALTFTSVSANYTRIGNMVFAYARLNYPVTADGSNSLIGGLPFTVANADYAQQGFVSYTTEATLARVLPVKNGTTLTPVTATGGNITNVTLSTDSIWFEAIYPIQ